MRVIITDEALSRLEGDLEFFVEVRKVPHEYAIRLAKKLTDRCKTLSTNPQQGQVEPFLTDLNQGHRRIVEGDFKIVYRILGNEIIVTDFFYTKKNWGRMKS